MNNYFNDWEDLSKIQYIFSEESKRIKKIENIITIDIETSNGFIPEGSSYAIGWDDTKYIQNPDFYKNCEKVSLLYHWQVAIDNTVNILTFSGRTYDDLVKFIHKLALTIEEKTGASMFNKKGGVQILMFVHNLGFEYQHFRNIWNDQFSRKFNRRSATFARTAHKPLKTSVRIKNTTITLRDSYVLVQKGLSKWCEDANLEEKKLEEPKGFYDPIRTPNTPLTDNELNYNRNDVVCMVYGLRKYAAEYGSIWNVPMTQTGTVRKKCLEALKNNEEWMLKCYEITAHYDFDFYKILTQSFLGGWTHANCFFANKTLTDLTCRDFASSYPAVMTLKTFPISEFVHVYNKELYEEYINQPFDETRKYHFLIKISCKSIKTNMQNTFWSSSKGFCDRILQLDNGRIKSAEEFCAWMTDLDFDVFTRAYECQELCIEDMYISEAGYLPTELICTILDYYGKKTELKGVDEGSKYVESKQFINSIYGAAVTKMINDLIKFEESGWDKDVLTEESFYTQLDDLVKPYTKRCEGKKSELKMFLAYQHGVWVTAWARHNLWEAIFALDEHTAYCDTDSCKGTYTIADLKFFDEYNKRLEDQQNKVANILGIDPLLYAPKDKHGIRHRLGVFDDDGYYFEFKTLGAKRYCYRAINKKGKMEVKSTIAGLPKSAGSRKIKNVSDFENEIMWNALESDKKIAYYCDKQPSIDWIDRDGNIYHSDDKYGVCIMPTEFNLSMASDYLKLLDYLAGDVDEEELSTTPQILSI